MSPTHLLVTFLLLVAMFGTMHLLALAHENRVSRAYLALGF
jgi:hypothetical protein